MRAARRPYGRITEPPLPPPGNIFFPLKGWGVLSLPPQPGGGPRRRGKEGEKKLNPPPPAEKGGREDKQKNQGGGFLGDFLWGAGEPP